MHFIITHYIIGYGYRFEILKDDSYLFDTELILYYITKLMKKNRRQKRLRVDLYKKRWKFNLFPTYLLNKYK